MHQAMLDRNVKDNFVRVKTQFSAISVGTEVAAYNGMPPLRPVTDPYPRKVGYCNVGRIKEVGPSVRGFTVGDLIYTLASHCSIYDISENQVLAVIPETVFAPHAALCYLYHLGLSALHASELKAGCSSIFIGGGNLSLHAAQIFRAQGIHVDIISEYSDTSAIGDGSRIFSRKEAANFSEQYDGVIIFSNSWQDYFLALQLTKFRGILVLVGFPGRGEPSVNFNPLDSQFVYDKQLTIRACGKNDLDQTSLQEFKDRCKMIIKDISDQILDANILLDKVVSWESLPQIYSELSKGSARTGTVVLDWRGA
jgi:threonine dehydrogenase-like Zn-dependent dehydrogenase